MTMLASSPLDQFDHNLFGVTEDDFSSYFYQAADSLRIDTQNWFDTLLDERNVFCSVSSSACPSITSELSDFDALMNDSFSQESLVQHTEEEERTTILCPSPNRRNCHPKKKEAPPRTSKWSNMSIKEKTTTLERLMETVSEKLGLREQLEIIKIINPNARLLPTDTEFFIDFDLMDDRKYDLVQLFVEKELRRDRLSETPEKKTTQKNTDKILKQKRKMQRKEQIKKRDKLKAFKQLQKEERSGLFSREQVIAMASFTVTEQKEVVEDEEEEEVDILS